MITKFHGQVLIIYRTYGQKRINRVQPICKMTNFEVAKLYLYLGY